MFEPSNWQIECRTCSDKSAQAAVIERAEINALRRAGLAADAGQAILPGMPDLPKPPPLPVSPPEDPSEPISIPDRLTWNPEALSEFAWLRPLLDVPENASPPLAMTRPRPGIVGSYGAEAVEWIEAAERKTLRWWQRLAVTRQLEHLADGSLAHRVVCESAPRRAGKSVRLRGVALWRMDHGPALFGETQLVMHTGKDVAIVREIQRAAWRWAEEVMGWEVSRANGKEALETLGGDRWLARAMHSVYGYDVCLGMVDEGWDVDPAAVDEGMEPATLERQSPQLHLTSTAHRRATSLMRRRIGNALAGDDGETLLLLWAARPGADISDPETWRVASPHWTDQRRKMIEGKYLAALAGESDPEADDPDPMAGFTAQYLNQWSLRATAAVPGSPVVSADEWAGLVEAVAGPADALAVEGWPGEGISVARAWRRGEAVAVSVEDVPDVAQAAGLVAMWQAPRRALVGKSLTEDPAFAGLRVTPVTGSMREAVADLQRLLTDGVLRHDAGEHLRTQVLELRVSPGVDGIRVRSTGRADAVKAAVRAAQAARRKGTGRPRIIAV